MRRLRLRRRHDAKFTDADRLEVDIRNLRAVLRLTAYIMLNRSKSVYLHVAGSRRQRGRAPTADLVIDHKLSTASGAVDGVVEL